MNPKLSTLRARLKQTQLQLEALLEDCFGREPLLPATLYTLRRKCGKPNCRCTQGELHASLVLSYRGDGRPRNISPPPEQVELLQAMTTEYRRVRKARAKLVRWQQRLLELVDQLQAARVQLGEAQFRKTSAPSPRKPRSPRS